MKIYQANQKYGYTLKETGLYLGLHYTVLEIGFGPGCTLVKMDETVGQIGKI